MTQTLLKGCNADSREKLPDDAPMRHNAAGDVFLTLIALIELLRFKGMDFSRIENWNLLAFDL